jgi:hypothetical protein
LSLSNTAQENKANQGQRPLFAKRIFMKRNFSFNRTVQADTGGPVLFRGWKEYEAGDFVVGKLVGSYESEYRGQKNTNWKVKVYECNFKVDVEGRGMVDPSVEQEVIVLNGNGRLNKFMNDSVKVGMIVDIEYDGKKKGGDDAEYHTFSRLEAGYEDGESPAPVADGKAAPAEKSKSRGL